MNRRKLKKSVRRKIDGIIMLIIAAMCMATECDTAAVCIAFYGIFCLISSDKRRNSVIYRIAKAIVDGEERGRESKSA